ncbi:MAG: hypothetical protein AAF940_02545 [Pseudomonadota bacterium]
MASNANSAAIAGLVALFTSAPLPAFAWEAKFGPICELIYEGEPAGVRLTYDPSIPEYSIAITPNQPWPEGPIFAMRFDGPRGNMISTNRHQLSDGGATVTVIDRGFGNVLNGLEFNDTATALLGDRSVTVPLDGAAPEVQAFRACASGMSV